MFTSMRSSHFTVNGIAKTLMIAPPKWMNGNRMNVMTLYRGASRMIIALMSLLIGHHIRVNVPLALRTTSRTCLESENRNGEPELAGDDVHVKPAR
jgi:hypothetical protein